MWSLSIRHYHLQPPPPQKNQPNLCTTEDLQYWKTTDLQNISPQSLPEEEGITMQKQCKPGLPPLFLNKGCRIKINEVDLVNNRSL